MGCIERAGPDCCTRLQGLLVGRPPLLSTAGLPPLPSSHGRHSHKGAEGAEAAPEDPLAGLLEAGMDVAGLDLAHGTVQQHGALMRHLRQVWPALLLQKRSRLAHSATLMLHLQQMHPPRCTALPSCALTAMGTAYAPCSWGCGPVSSAACSRHKP